MECTLAGCIIQGVEPIVPAPPTFQVYIDESGDEGFVFKPDGSGSSSWFVLSAAVVRTANDGLLSKCMLEFKELLKKDPRKPLHFVKLDHDVRKALSTKIAKLPCCFVSVAFFKKAPGENPFAGEGHLLYRYLTRLLLERVSWLCRDTRKAAEPNCTAKIIFSNRSCMSYDLIRDYLRYLRDSKWPEGKVRICWDVINPDLVVALPHDQKSGLQIVDAVASGVYAAVTPNRFGQTEPAYAENMLPRFYRHNERLLGYGMKWYPNDLAKIEAANPHFGRLAAWK